MPCEVDQTHTHAAKQMDGARSLRPEIKDQTTYAGQASHGSRKAEAVKRERQMDRYTRALTLMEKERTQLFTRL